MTDQELDLASACADSLFLLLMLGAPTFWVFKMLRRFPYVNVATDEDGLWLQHIGKEKGLISWRAVARVRRNSWLRCLDVFDKDGRILISIDFRLNDYVDLMYSLVYSSVRNVTLTGTPLVYKRNWGYHLTELALITATFLLGWYSMNHEQEGHIYIFLGLMLIYMVYRYLQRECKAVFNTHTLDFFYPLSHCTIHFSDIQTVEIEWGKSKRGKDLYPTYWLVISTADNASKQIRFYLEAKLLILSIQAVIEQRNILLQEKTKLS